MQFVYPCIHYEALALGLPVCDYDVYGDCLVSFRNKATGVLLATCAAEPVRGSVTGGEKNWPMLKLIRASGNLPRTEMFPDDLELLLEIDLQQPQATGSYSVPELKGGFRKVYHLNGVWPCHNIVLKLRLRPTMLMRSNVLLCARPLLCTSSTAVQSKFPWGADGLCRAHYIIAERVIPLAALLESGSALPAETRASLAFQCCRVLFRATVAGIKWAPSVSSWPSPDDIPLGTDGEARGCSNM